MTNLLLRWLAALSETVSFPAQTYDANILCAVYCCHALKMWNRV